MLFWYFLSSMSVMFHENLRCLGQCSKRMQNAKFETWCGATALSIRTSPDEPEKTSCARQNWEVEESERKVLNMSRNVTKCHTNSYPIQSLYVRASSTTRITRRRLSETSLTTALRRSSKMHSKDGAWKTVWLKATNLLQENFLRSSKSPR